MQSVERQYQNEIDDLRKEQDYLLDLLTNAYVELNKLCAGDFEGRPLARVMQAKLLDAGRIS
jgi:hypothetical protein